MGLSNAGRVRRWGLPTTLTCLSAAAFVIGQDNPADLVGPQPHASSLAVGVSQPDQLQSGRAANTSSTGKPLTVFRRQRTAATTVHPVQLATEYLPVPKELSKQNQVPASVPSDLHSKSNGDIATNAPAERSTVLPSQKSLTTFLQSGPRRTIPDSIRTPSKGLENSNTAATSTSFHRDATVGDHSQVSRLTPTVIESPIPVREGKAFRPPANVSGRDRVPASQTESQFEQVADDGREEVSIAPPISSDFESQHFAAVPSDEPKKSSTKPSQNPPSTVTDSSRVAVAEDEQTAERERVGRLVSQRNLGNADLPGPEVNPLKPIESPLGWAAIEQEMRARLERCESLLARGAVFSARQEAIEGLRYLTQAIDGRHQSDRHSRALAMAIQALREELDFVETAAVPTDVGAADSVGLIEHYVKSHITPVLKDRALSGVSPIVAAQYYRAFAREQFVIAMDGIVWGADLLYAYGKSLEAQANENSALRIVYLQQAQAVHEAALLITPRHALNANQLGYVLLKLDRPIEARDRLLESIEAMPMTVTWQNLAEAFRRLNDRTGIAWANDNYARSLQRPNAIDPTIPQVTEVPPEQFVAISPRALSNGPESINQSSSASLADTQRIQPGVIQSPVAPMAEQPPAQAVRTSPTRMMPPTVPETANRSWLFPWLR